MPRPPAPRPAEQAAAHHLWELLRRNERYRRVWVYMAREENLEVVDGEVNEEAVRRVVVDYLCDKGVIEEPRPLSEKGKPKRLWKDQIYDARNHLRLSPTTLSAFIGAFDISEDDQARLYRIHSDRVPTGNPTHNPTIQPSGLKVPPAEHATIALHEYHYLGADGLPHHHETNQAIRSLVDELVAYPYRFDTNEVRDVKVLHGGYAGDIYQVQEDVYAVDIVLDTPLKLGQATTLRYITRFRYTDPPRPAFARPIPRTTDLIEIRVTFHKQRLPSRVWFVVWEDWTDSSRILHQEEVVPDVGRSVHRLLTEAGGTVVGFHWEW